MQGILIAGAIVALPFYLRPAIIKEVQILILVGIGILATVFQPAYRATEGSRTAEDEGTAVQIVWSVYFVHLAGLLEATVLRYPESFRFNLVTVLGLVGMIAGLVVRSWAVYELGKFFTWNVEIQEGQTVIKTGPYRFVRHPSYTGAFLTSFCSPIFLHSWYAAALAGPVLAIAFLRRIRNEEALLKKELPGYDDYIRTTKALIPGLF